jgi:D-glycero-alpha-D-manno-heptose-7-phosphate kinase
LKFFGIKSNIEITSFADIPTIGNGLGGSSAFTCALVKALSAYLGYEYVNPYGVAKTACHIEIDLCGWKIGMQDQFASAFGGMNYIEYANELGYGRVDVKRLDSNAIENYMILIPTNVEHHAAKILDNIDFEAKTFTIRELARMAEMRGTQPVNPLDYGNLLNSAWILKKQMSDEVSSSDIDTMYERCKSAGAMGAKLLGAGGGGYMLALTDSKEKIRREFSDRTCLDVGIAHEGARVVYTD